MPRLRRIAWCVGALAFLSTGVDGQTAARQVELGHRSALVLRVDGLEFKDLNRNGRLDAYEDWRLPPEARTTDLLKQMTIEEMAGVMVHGTLPTGGALGSIGRGDGGGYDLAKTRAAIEERHANSFITRLAGKASFIAEQNNAVQELAEGTRLGIPLTISTDPRHHFEEVLGASVGGKTFSQRPETLGFRVIGDERLMRRFGDMARQEYAAVGIREALSPQADLVTEPRWARANGTFGEDPVLVKRMVKAYVEGFQGGEAGLTATGVMTVVKHWVGYCAEKDGWDGHNFYGRFVDLSDASLQTHLFPFTGAFEAHVAGVMPTYPILHGPTVDGRPLEANFALVRAPAPYESQHTRYFFGSRQHEGRLNFVESDKAYAEFLRVSAAVPTILTTTLERPLILTNVKDHAAVLLGDFGLADEALREVVTGKIKAEGKLPFELPSLSEAVEKQRSDLPHDSAAPLYKIGYGLRY